MWLLRWTSPLGRQRSEEFSPKCPTIVYIMCRKRGGPLCVPFKDSVSKLFPPELSPVPPCWLHRWLHLRHLDSNNDRLSTCSLTSCRDVARRMTTIHNFEDYPGSESGDVHEEPPGGFGGRKPVSYHFLHRVKFLVCVGLE